MASPKLAKGAAKGDLFAVRAAVAEAENIQTAITKSSLTKPDWARNALINAASSL